MEPVFMILGQSAGTAAVLAVEHRGAVQEVPYETLRERLLEDGQVLDAPPDAKSSGRTGVPSKTLEGIVVDDTDAELKGSWQPSTATSRWIGAHYLHDGNTNKGESAARFARRLPSAGRYEVRVSYSPHPNRAEQVRATVRHDDGETRRTINQQKEPDKNELFVSLGEFYFATDRDAVVEINNDGSEGHVIVDAVQFLRLGDN
jgi:hypothetical protein